MIKKIFSLKFNALFVIKYTQYYHKLQYSKVPKFDVAAALFGVIVSAFFGYLTLSTLGSAGADLSDMLILFWYIFLIYKIVWYIIFLQKNSYNFYISPVFIIYTVFYQFFLLFSHN